MHDFCICADKSDSAKTVGSTKHHAVSLRPPKDSQYPSVAQKGTEDSQLNIWCSHPAVFTKPRY